MKLVEDIVTDSLYFLRLNLSDSLVSTCKVCDDFIISLFIQQNCTQHKFGKEKAGKQRQTRIVTISICH